jgi:tRNA U34 5-methylaminomethyl-2-thiouridine-forming methyltransferase MnmC
MNHELKIVKTADGSNTIYNVEVGENYHSKHGALQESRHVFINAGLCYILKKREVEVSPTGGDLEGALADTTVSILEVGFGTGLNFLLSADLCTERKISMDYTGIEAYPLSLEMISQTGYDQYLPSALWTNFINKYPDGLINPVSLNSYCKLQIANCKLLNFQSKQQFDIIYFDAFAVARQPEMWDEAAIGHTMRFLKPGGVFVTYAITGNLKRSLKALGCKVEKAPGAPGKREMLRAVKPGPLI